MRGSVLRIRRCSDSTRTLARRCWAVINSPVSCQHGHASCPAHKALNGWQNAMATIYTHAVVGLGMARLATPRSMPWLYWGLAAGLAVLPDLDAFSYAAYGGWLGHRGVTHCLAFALLAGMLAAGATFRPLRTNGWLLGGLFFAIIASHGLLDAMTKGGMEIPFFWPLGARFGNWGPIPVSDLSFELPDPRKSLALRAELLWIWLPTGILVGLITVYRRITATKD